MSHASREQRSKAVLRKADKFSADNDGSKRVQAKQAILLELNAQLKSRTERPRSKHIG